MIIIPNIYITEENRTNDVIGLPFHSGDEHGRGVSRHGQRQYPLRRWSYIPVGTRQIGCSIYTTFGRGFFLPNVTVCVMKHVPTDKRRKTNEQTCHCSSPHLEHFVVGPVRCPCWIGYIDHPLQILAEFHCLCVCCGVLGWFVLLLLLLLWNYFFLSSAMI